MNKKKIECAVCKKQFHPPKKTGSHPKYCSDECRHESRLISIRKYAEKKRFKELRTCPICGVSFIADGHHQIYCSRKCARRQESNLKIERRIDNAPISKCPVCGKTFKNKGGRTYCSQECYRESKIKPQQAHECPVCGKEFIQRGHKRKYCSPQCSSEAQKEVYKRNTLTRRALRKNNGATEWINPREIFERDGWRCQLCGKRVSKRLYRIKGTARYPNAPSIDHIIPLSKGGQHTKVNVQCACYLCNCKKGNKIKGQLRLFG